VNQLFETFYVEISVYASDTGPWAMTGKNDLVQ